MEERLTPKEMIPEDEVLRPITGTGAQGRSRMRSGCGSEVRESTAHPLWPQGQAAARVGGLETSQPVHTAGGGGVAAAAGHRPRLLGPRNRYRAAPQFHSSGNTRGKGTPRSTRRPVRVESDCAGPSLRPVPITEGCGVTVTGYQ